jgi:hypothetical protein
MIGAIAVAAFAFALFCGIIVGAVYFINKAESAANGASIANDSKRTAPWCGDRPTGQTSRRTP